MKIYTKTGDQGQTSLLGGTRVLKHNHKIEAFGTVDELNANIGLLLSFSCLESQFQILNFIQNRLFIVGSNLAAEENCQYPLPQLLNTDTEKLEIEIDSLSGNLPTLRHFILPAGSREISHIHIARTICRRAERNVVEIQANNSQEIIRFLNRLSDYLFVLARYCHQTQQIDEVFWIAEV